MTTRSRTGTKSVQLIVLVVLLFLIVPSVLCAAGLWFLSGEATPIHAERAFDRAAWGAFERDANGFSSRLPMAQSLVRDGTLDALTRTEVEALLGPPDQRRWSRPWPYPGWSVGRNPGGASDSTGLLIEFDDAGRVREIHTPGYGAALR